jgi:hypothetical protein
MTISGKKLDPSNGVSLCEMVEWGARTWDWPSSLSVSERDRGATMIPAFDEHGYLPPGVHPVTLDEVAARFGCESEVRRVQMESLRWLVDLGRRAGVERLVINGSFVTDVLEPNDVDCVLLIGSGFPREPLAEAELLAGLPFLELSLVNQADFELLVERFFATDRHSVSKDMLEIIQ